MVGVGRPRFRSARCHRALMTGDFRAEGQVVAGRPAGAGASAGDGSLWSATAPEFTGGSVARGTMSADVVVVGAGIAGLSTALHLRELSIETVVVEAERPGDGATGASGGIVAPDFSRGGIAKARAQHGEEEGRRLARLVGDSAAFTFDLIRRYRIECDPQAEGFVSPGRSASEVAALRADAREWKALGCTVEFLDERRTAELVGSDAYRGALYFESGGALNPRAYANGLADVVVALGADIFTDSAVLRVEARDGKWHLHTRVARIVANRVVLAANGGNMRLHAALDRTTLPLTVYEYATAPISVADRKRYFGAGLPYTDRQAYVFSVRFDREDRIISAVPELVPRLRRKTLIREARRRFRDLYSMELPPIDFVWRGTAYLNPTLLPAVYGVDDEPGILAIQACNGRGLAINTILGKQVAELLAGRDRRALAAPLLRPRPLPLHAIAARVPRMAMAVARAKDRCFRTRPAS